MLDELALFAGAGGGILGTRTFARVVGAVELDPYCREVLLRRQEETILDPFPIWDDIGTFDGRPWRGAVDLVTAGFPCQPWSVAGKRAGAEDSRNLWPDTARVLGEVGATWVLLENVPGLASHPYFGRIVADLASLGYVCRWACLSAAAVGAPHRRDRLWIVCHTDGDSEPALPVDGEVAELPRVVADASGASPEKSLFASGGAVADAEVKRPQIRKCASRRWPAVESDGSCGAWWRVEPDVGRMADGVAFRLDRLRAIGGGQVAPVVRRVWELMTR